MFIERVMEISEKRIYLNSSVKIYVWKVIVPIIVSGM